MSAEDWVERRATCTPEGAFDAIMRIVKRDVALFNELEGELRGGRLFMCEEHAGVWAVRRARRVYDWRPPQQFTLDPHPEHRDDTVSICIDGGMIVATRPDGLVNAAVEPEWNHSTLQCELVVAGEVLDVAQVSHAMIGDLLFPDPEDDE